jgi:hypothetical protein
VTLPKISTPMTATQLRARVIAQLSASNGHAKEKTK